MYRFSSRMNRVTASAIREIMKCMSDPTLISLGGGNPAPESFPVEQIRDIAAKLLQEQPNKMLQYGLTLGWDPLREAYLQHMVLPKGIDATLDNIIIFTGSTEGIHLTADVFLDEGDVVLVEDPSFLGTLNVLRKLGARIYGVKTDGDGVLLDDLEAKIRELHPKLFYTIPTFQNPTGRTTALERRRRIAELADEYQMIVLEDDPYADVRISGTPLPPIKKFDQSGYVVLMNSFSKIISPGLRVGAAVADPEIVRKLEMVKQGVDVNTSILPQAICAEFLDRGLLPQQLERISRIYGVRLQAMLDGLRREFPAGTRFTEPEGGLFVWAQIPGVADTTALLQRAIRECHVAYVPGETFCLDPNEGKDSIRLNFSASSPEQITTAIQRLGRLFRDAAV